ncbi:hypothetical protein PGA2_c18930 [Phaeobacter inhibens 2.10]|nr:hypothetical protein PGA2_c18930 [Phaeobacter inhibens 2.10]
MSGQPILIIEGRTDIQAYDKLRSRLSIKVNLKPVELVKDYGEGNDQVIQLIRDLETIDRTGQLVSGNVIGVIDKDVRDFRGEVPESDHIVVLKNYSIESYFVCESVLDGCILQATSAPKDGRISAISRDVFNRFTEYCDDLYLASLDALRGAIEFEHSAKFGYSNSFGNLKNTALRSAIRNERTELEAFAGNRGLERSVNSMRSFVKGKVFLDALCSHVVSELKNLPSVCENSDEVCCDYCTAGTRNKCLYKVKPAVSASTIRNTILDQFPNIEFRELIEEINGRVVAA